MTFQIRLLGVDKMLRNLDTLEAREQRALAGLMREEANGIARQARTNSLGLTTFTRMAGETLRTEMELHGATVRAGAPGLVSKILRGAEFGGRKRRTTYVNRRGDKLFIVHERATTMQFLPHRGRIGYWYWPGVRTQVKGVMGRAADVVERVGAHRV